MGEAFLIGSGVQGSVKSIQFFDNTALPLFGSSELSITHTLDFPVNMNRSIIITQVRATNQSTWRSDASKAYVKFQDNQTLYAERCVGSSTYHAITSGFVIEFDNVRRKISDLVFLESGYINSVDLPDNINLDKCIVSYSSNTEFSGINGMFPLELELKYVVGEPKLVFAQLAKNVYYEILEFF